MQKIYLQLIDQAVADSVITPEQYLQIPWDECGSMRYLFSPAGRQAIAAGIITFKEYLRIPCEERKSMKYLFSSGGRHALADGIITLEQYLKIPLDERESMEYLFSLDGRQTVAENIITLKQYLQIPCEERKSMKYFFSHDVRQAVADGIITLERYLQIPSRERKDAMTVLQNPNTRRISCDVRQALADGLITLEQYLKIPRDEFGSLYRDRTDPDFTALVEAGKDVKLDDLNTFQEQVQNGYLNEHRSDGSETHKEEVGVIDLQKLIYAKSILLELKKLENKAKNLRDRNHILAYCKAANIVQLLRGLNQDYFTEKKIDYKTYKEKSLAIINQECPELDKHRGYKQILGNLLILILTLGTAQLINKACTGNFLFFKKTDSSKLIDNVSHTIEKMEFALMI